MRVALIALSLMLYTTVRAQEDSLTLKKCLVSAALPAAMITYGILSLESHAIMQLDYSTRSELEEDNSMLYNKLDNYFQFAPAAAAFTMKACGVKSRHSAADMAIIYALANALETGVVYTVKATSTRTRPDGSSSNSFPSGHTATAFVAAEFLHQEYRDQSVWISVGGYAMATMIGASRVYNNRHWVSDVVAGAGIGMLSTKVVYWTYPALKRAFNPKKRDIHGMLFPGYYDGVFCMNLAYSF